MCGVIGIAGYSHVVQDIYDGLISIQHRGQDAAGIATYSQRIHLVKGTGLVNQIFDQVRISKLMGNLGIGHTRYPTVGAAGAEDAQPFFVNSPYGIAMVHNGNVTNFEPLKKELFDKNKRHVSSSCDVELILNVFADEFEHKTGKFTDNYYRAVNGVFRRVKGTYSCVGIIAGQGLFAFRDPYGIRPLIYGRRKHKNGWEYCFASESCALTMLGFEKVRDVIPGEAIFIDNKKRMHSKIICKKPHRPCIFEYIYFARPDSLIDKISVYKMRLRLGKALAKQFLKTGLDADVVIPIPDSSRPAALSMAYHMNKKYREGLLKNRYIGRTFIMSSQHLRNKNIRYKLSPLTLEIKNKNVLLVDDSIVRGTTSKQIIDMVRGNKAKKVYFVSSCPPLKYPCVYGIDMTRKRELIASKKSVDQIRKEIGADFLLYMNIHELKKAAKAGNKQIDDLCSACMDGIYPTGDITPAVLKRMSGERTMSKKKAKFE